MKDLVPGAQLGRYRLVALLGRGGMGSVWRAADEAGREVALKAIAPHLARDERFLERFAREGTAGRSVRHENVVSVLDAGATADLRFLVLELAPGGSLEEHVKRSGPLPWPRAARLGAGVARGLAAIHEAGLVHRDLKPQNVLLDAAGAPKIADLGLVGTTERAGPSLTRTGELLGTPAYMAPEQLEDARTIDERADLHALGAVLHFALTGDPPFAGEGAAVLAQVLKAKPRSVRERAPGCLPELDALVARLLSKRPEERGAGAAHVARELEAIAKRGEPARRTRATALIGVWIALIAAGSIFALKARPKETTSPRPTPPVSTPPPPPPAPASEPTFELTDRLYDADKTMQAGRELAGKEQLARAREAFSRVVDSSTSGPELLSEAQRALLDLAPSVSGESDGARAAQWRLRIILVERIETAQGSASFDDPVRALVELGDSVKKLTERVLERTRGCVRIVPSFERCEKPLTELYPVAGGFAPTRDALGAVIDDIERWTPPESACDEVLVVVPLGKIAPPAQPWVEWILTHGGRLVAHVAPSGQIPDATALLGSFFECADDALVRSQGWPRERIRVDPPEMVPDAVWRTLSTRRAPRTAWTRGDFRTFKMLAPEPADLVNKGRTLAKLRGRSFDRATIFDVPAPLVFVERLFPQAEVVAATAARAWAYVPRDVRAVVFVRWDDFVEVEVGGSNVFVENALEHEIVADPVRSDVFPLVKGGNNPITVRVENVGGPWGFELRFRDERGQPIEGIEITAEKR